MLPYSNCTIKSFTNNVTQFAFEVTATKITVKQRIINKFIASKVINILKLSLMLKAKCIFLI